MDIEGRNVLILGGTGLVGMAVARNLLEHRPARLGIAGLQEEDAREAVRTLSSEPGGDEVEIVPEWGDIFLPESKKEASRRELLNNEESRAELLDELFGSLDSAAYDRSALIQLLERQRPDILIDGVNTATAIAYQNVFASAERVRRKAREEGGASAAEVEAHLSTLHLPQLIRHVQYMLEGMRRADTSVYLKIGTSGTGGMGLNVPFTHSEERPSRELLAKSSVAGAHTLLLYLMARTPEAPVVKEVKPTAAIAWKEIEYGPVHRGGDPIARYDASSPMPVEEALNDPSEEAWEETGEVIESVYLDAGENGLFSLGEFEAISSLGLMELVTPEEIADVIESEILGRPTGRDIIAALDASSMGPSYRAGVMRESALRQMESLEEEHDVRSVAFEMLGPPRLSKLLFEAEILRRACTDVREAMNLDETEVARRAREIVGEDDRLRSDVLSIGLPILLPGGDRMLRGPDVKVAPEDDGDPRDTRWSEQGWVDLRPQCWVRWRRRCRQFVHREVDPPGPEMGSREDLDVRARSGEIRPGALAAFVFRTEDGGARIKR
ncbi:MAG: hypothetical protein Q8W44_08520 [Candidatus Palauibacterales bacterium]|nr:hypothetical protein [Candidatus Palauibacterales bacterium]